VWYYKEQAARGNSAAILNLAVCHLSGVGMLKDSTAGVCVCVCAHVCQLSGNAAELCCRCGVDEGRGIAGQCYGGAEEVRHASRLHSIHCVVASCVQAHSLGLCCWTGEGTAVDLDEAHKWLSKAAGQGVVMAAESLELLEQEREKQAKK
jgi:TPR repeat protein